MGWEAEKTSRKKLFGSFRAKEDFWQFHDAGSLKKMRVQSPPRMRASGKYPSLAEIPRELNCKRRGTSNR